MITLAHNESRINTRLRNTTGCTILFVSTLLVLVSYSACSAASGTLISFLKLLTRVALERSYNGLCKGPILFFAISTFIEFLCIILYAIYFTRLPMVKHYRARAALHGTKTVSADLAAAGIQTQTNDQGGDDTKQQERLSNKQLFLQNLNYAADLFLIYLLTLSIFPAFLYENTGSHQLGTCFAVPYSDTATRVAPLPSASNL